jgi:hypothetical protein
MNRICTRKKTNTIIQLPMKENGTIHRMRDHYKKELSSIRQPFILSNWKSLFTQGAVDHITTASEKRQQPDVIDQVRRAKVDHHTE